MTHYNFVVITNDQYILEKNVNFLYAMHCIFYSYRRFKLKFIRSKTAFFKTLH
jgi:hypothetical protein